MVSAVGPDARHSLQVMGTDLQQGFTLTGNVAWAFPESGPNVPKQSELAFQLKVGTWRNDAPAAADDFAVTNGQTPVDVFVLANDRDPNGDPLTILILTQPRFGTVEIHGQDTPDDPADDFIRYLPGAEYVGSDSFTYAVRDRYGAVSTATVTVAEFGQALNGVFAEDSIWPQAL
ncbi:MAG: cadherin-like domain-containing protein [Planctomycetia bacterium]|nr:cadherin-like domain-containing protein [Planctomycetia bacterium]